MDPRVRAEILQDLRTYAPTIELEEIVASHGSPLIVIDPARARARVAQLENELPFVRLNYAVTALPHPSIVRALWGRTGFSLSTVRELDLLEAAGVPADGAILTLPVKTPADIARSYAAGIRTFMVDSPAEVDKFVGLAKDLRVLVRIATGDAASPAAGIAPENVVNLVRYALSRGINTSGIALHLGSAAQSAQQVGDAVRRSIAVIDEVERRLGVHLDMLDLGGGWGAPAELATVGSVLRSVLGPRAGSITVIAEPGRCIADAATLHVTRVIGQSTRDGVVVQHIDDGVDGALTMAASASEPVLFGLQEVLGDTERLFPSVIVGSSGTDRDVLSTDALLPALAIGDIIVGARVGAYSQAVALGSAPSTPIVVTGEVTDTRPAAAPARGLVAVA
ncbi:MAG: hypothetical protein ABWX82_12240 [Leifsonia sp.]